MQTGLPIVLNILADLPSHQKAADQEAFEMRKKKTQLQNENGKDKGKNGMVLLQAITRGMQHLVK